MWQYYIGALPWQDWNCQDVNILREQKYIFWWGDKFFKVAYYSFIGVPEVYTINVQLFIFLHQYSDNK